MKGMTETSKRDLGLDLIRLLSMIAITLHHFVWVVWYTPDIAPTEYSFLWKITGIYSRALSFSGHTILFLSCFLIARAETHPRKTWQVVAWVLFGWVLFCLFEMGENPVFWVWDIYPLIATGLATSVLFHIFCKKFFPAQASKALMGFAAAGFFLTWIPFWKFEYFNSMSLQWRHWWVGDCSVDLADWPILPWIGFAWCAYGLGIYAYERKKTGQKWLQDWKKIEYFVWPLILIPSIPQWGAFYNIVLGPQFACFSFRQEPWVFWSHFAFVIFFLRLSLLASVQSFLAGLPIMHGIARLRLSTHFGIFYLVHYILIEACKVFKFDYKGADAHWSYLALIMIMPLSELCVRLILRVNELIVSRRQTS